MKILFLTSSINPEHGGWGRYSKDLIESLSAGGVECVTADNLPSPLSYNRNYFLSFLYAWRLRKLARDCDAIHALVEPYSCIAYLLSLWTGKPYFVTAHGTFSVWPYYLSPLKRYLHKRSFARASKVICVSDYTKDRLSHFHLNNLQVIHNGIDSTHFRDSPYIDKEDIILSVGAPKPRKGYLVSIQAFAEVSKKFPDLKYIIVGNQADLGYFNQLKNLISELGLEDKVQFLENISNDELLDLYKKAKLFILLPISERTHFEGFGLVYLEAGASGLPVVGTLHSGAESAIKDGITGFLVPQNDSIEVAKVMERLLEDSGLRHRLGESGVLWAKEHDWGNIREAYIREYKAD